MTRRCSAQRRKGRPADSSIRCERRPSRPRSGPCCSMVDEDARIQFGVQATSAISASNGLVGCVESAAVRLHGRPATVTARRSHRRAALAALLLPLLVSLSSLCSAISTALPSTSSLQPLSPVSSSPLDPCDCAWRSAVAALVMVRQPAACAAATAVAASPAQTNMQTQ